MRIIASKEQATAQRLRAIVEQRMKSKQVLAESTGASLRDRAAAERRAAVSNQLQEMASMNQQQQDSLYAALAAKQEEGLPSTEGLMLTADERAAMREQGALRAQRVQAELIALATKRASEIARDQIQAQIDLTLKQKEDLLKAQEARYEQVIRQYIVDSAQQMDADTQANLVSVYTQIIDANAQANVAYNLANTEIGRAEAQVIEFRNSVNAITKQLADDIINRALGYDTFLEQRKTLEDQAIAISAAVVGLNNELALARSQKVTADANVATFNGEISALNTALTARRQELAAVAQELANLPTIDPDGVRTRLQQRQTEINGAIATIEADLRTATSDLDAAIRAIGRATSDRTKAIQDKAAALASAVGLAQSDFSGLAGKLATAKIDFDAADTLTRGLDSQRNAISDVQRPAAFDTWNTTKTQHLDRLQTAFDTYVRDQFNPADSARGAAFKTLDDAVREFSRLEGLNSTETQLLSQVQVALQSGVPIRTSAHILMQLQMDGLMTNLTTTYPAAEATARGLVTSAQSLMDGYAPTIAPTSVAAMDVARTLPHAQSAQAAYDTATTSLSNIVQIIRDKVVARVELERTRLQLLSERQVPRAAFKQIMAAQQAYNSGQRQAKAGEKTTAAGDATTAAAAARARPAGLQANLTLVQAKQVARAPLPGQRDAKQTQINQVDVAGPGAAKTIVEGLASQTRPLATAAATNLSGDLASKSRLEGSLGTNGALKTSAEGALGTATTAADTASGTFAAPSTSLDSVLSGRSADSGQVSTLETSTLPFAQTDTGSKSGQLDTAVAARTSILGQRQGDVTAASTALTSATTMRDGNAANLPAADQAVATAQTAASKAATERTTTQDGLAPKGTLLSDAASAKSSASSSLDSTTRDLAGIVAIEPTAPVAPTKTAAHLLAESRDGPLLAKVQAAEPATVPTQEYTTLVTTTIPAKEGEVSTAQTNADTLQASLRRVAGLLTPAAQRKSEVEGPLKTAKDTLAAAKAEKSQREIDGAVYVQSKADAQDRLTLKKFFQSAYTLYTSIKQNSDTSQTAARGSKQQAAIDKGNSASDATVAATNVGSAVGRIAGFFTSLGSKTTQQVAANTSLGTYTTTTIPAATKAKSDASTELGSLQAPVKPAMPSLEDNTATRDSLQGQLDGLGIAAGKTAEGAATSSASATTSEMVSTQAGLDATLTGRTTDTTTLGGLDAAAATMATQDAITALGVAQASKPTFMSASEASAAITTAEGSIAAATASLPDAEAAITPAKTASDDATTESGDAQTTKGEMATTLAGLKTTLEGTISGLDVTTKSLRGAEKDAGDAYEITLSLTRPIEPSKSDLLVSLEGKEVILAQAVKDALRAVNQTVTDVQVIDGQIIIQTGRVTTAETTAGTAAAKVSEVGAQLTQAQIDADAATTALDSAEDTIDAKDAERTDTIEATDQATESRNIFMRLFNQGRANLSVFYQSIKGSYQTSQDSFKASRLAANQRKIDNMVDAAQFRPGLTANTLVTERDGKVVEVATLSDTTLIDSLIQAARDSHDTVLTTLNRESGTFQIVFKAGNNTTVVLNGDRALANRLSQELDTAREARESFEQSMSSPDEALSSTLSQLRDSSDSSRTLLDDRIADLTDLNALVKRLGLAQQDTASRETDITTAQDAKTTLEAQLSLPLDEATRRLDSATQYLSDSVDAYNRSVSDLAAIDTSLFEDYPSTGDSKFTGLADSVTVTQNLLDSINGGLDAASQAISTLLDTPDPGTRPTEPTQDGFRKNEEVRLNGLITTLETNIKSLQDSLAPILTAIQTQEGITEDQATQAADLATALADLSTTLQDARTQHTDIKTDLDGATTDITIDSTSITTTTTVNTSLRNIKSVLEGYLGTLRGRNLQREYLLGVREAYRIQMESARASKETATTTKTTDQGLAQALQTGPIKTEIETIAYLQGLLADKLRQKERLINELARLGDAMELARNLRDKAQLERLNDTFGRLKEALRQVQEAQRLYEENEARIKTLEEQIADQEKRVNKNRDDLERLRQELAYRLRLRNELRAKLLQAQRNLQDLRAELARLERENRALNAWRKTFKLPGSTIPIVQILAGLGAAAALGLGFALPSFFGMTDAEKEKEREDKCAAVRQLGYGNGLAKGRAEGFTKGKNDARKEYRRLRQQDMQRQLAQEAEARAEPEPDEEAVEDAAAEEEVPELEEPFDEEVQEGGQDEEVPEEELPEEEFPEEEVPEEEFPEEEAPEEAEAEPFQSPFEASYAPPTPDTVPYIVRSSIKVDVPPSISPECINDYIESYRDGYLKGVEDTYFNGWESFNPSAEIEFTGEEPEEEVPEEVEPTEEEEGYINGEAEPLPEDK